MAKDLSKVVIIDIEATCWRKGEAKGKTSEIIEVGLVVLDMKRKSIVGKYGELIKPMKSKISPFCTELTGISDAMYKGNEPDFKDYLWGLKAWLCMQYENKAWGVRALKDVTWASWGDYDRVQFNRNCTMYGVKYPFGRTHINIKNLFALKYGLPKELNVQDALAHLRMVFSGNLHRALDDALNITSLFMNAMWDERRFVEVQS